MTEEYGHTGPRFWGGDDWPTQEDPLFPEDDVDRREAARLAAE